MNLFRSPKEVSTELDRLRDLERKIPVMVRIAPGRSAASKVLLGAQMKVLAEHLGVDAVYQNWKEPTLPFALAACEWMLGGNKRPSDFWRSTGRRRLAFPGSPR